MPPAKALKNGFEILWLVETLDSYAKRLDHHFALHFHAGAFKQSLNIRIKFKQTRIESGSERMLLGLYSGV
jgi:hypothetical protein